MKRHLAFVLALVTCLSLFVACGKTEETKQTEEPAKEETDMFANSMQKSDPSQDDVYNILLVGSSAFYYQVEEMVGVAKGAGIKMNVYNLYYNGCTLQQTYDWWKTNQTNYQMFRTDEFDRVKTENVSLQYAMGLENWDAIALCNSGAAVLRTQTAEEFVSSQELYLTELLGMFRKEFPASKLYWQQHNAYQVGFSGTYFSVTTPEEQQADAQMFHRRSKLIAEKYNIQWVPRGDAGMIARANPVVGDTLCARLGINGNLGDNSHEGDIGGGQYLTACTWFEILFGQSCIGNTWRPNYVLSEEKIAALQQAAHEAVANMNN